MPYQAEREQLARRQKMLDALGQRAITPQQTQMVSGRAVPQGIMQQLGPVLQAMMAKKGGAEIAQRTGELDAQDAQGVKDAMSEAMTQYKGAPQRPYEMPPEQQFPNEPQIQGLESKAVPADPIGAAMNVATDPRLADSKSAQAMMMQLMKNKGGQSSGAAPYYNFLPSEKGYGVGNARTGDIVWPEGSPLKGSDSPNIAGGKRQAVSNVDLKMKPQIEAAVLTGKKGAEREHSMDNITAILDQADKIIDEGVATGSGIGSWVDAGGRLVGKTSKSAQAAAELEAIGGALTGKMPRFEGPQSDYDREYYQQMAGRVGNRDVPLAERKAALKQVRSLWAKYDKSAKQPKGFDSEKESRYQEWKAKQK